MFSFIESWKSKRQERLSALREKNKKEQLAARNEATEKLDEITRKMHETHCPIISGPCDGECINFKPGRVAYFFSKQVEPGVYRPIFDIYPPKCKLWRT